MDDQFDAMVKDFKSLDEMRAYSYAQQQTIVELSKKLNKYEAEVADLKKQLQNSIPKDPTVQNTQSQLAVGEDHEVIAKIQLNKLKEICFDRELTLDEVKRVEILVKVLNTGKKGSQENAPAEKPLSNEELLKVLESFN